MNSVRHLVCFSLLSATFALAQPANDTCDRALVVNPTKGLRRTLSPAVNIFNAANAAEAPLSCQTNTFSTVWFSFTPSESGQYEFQTCPATAVDATITNTVFAVYDGACDALVELTHGCNDNWCGNASRLVLELVAGRTYRLQVGKVNSAGNATDVAQVNVSRFSGADTCAGPVPELPLNIPVPIATTTEAPLFSTNAAQLGVAACYSGVDNVAGVASGADVVHRFTAPHTGEFNFRLSAPARQVDLAVYVTDSCAAAATPPFIYSPPACLAGANRAAYSSARSEEASCVALTAGQHAYVWVDEGDPIAPQLGVSTTLLATECTREVEPNETPATSSTLSCGAMGAFALEGDVDFFALPAHDAGTRLFAMVEAGAARVSTFEMRVTTATASVERDDNDLAEPFGGDAPGLAGVPLTAAPHYLRVNANAGTTVTQPYHVYTTLQAGAPVLEVEPNNTPQTAQSARANYFIGDLVDASDTDYFAFEAPAGAVIYLALDSEPTRASLVSPLATHALALYDEDGEVLFINNVQSISVPTASDGTLLSLTPNYPSEHLVFRTTFAGTYWAQVRRTSSTTAPGHYALSIGIDCLPGLGIAPPVLTSLTPTTGSVLGGTVVTLTGSGFGPGSVVTFDGEAAQVDSATATQLVVRTPVGSTGFADVTVRNHGQTPTTLTSGFTYFTPSTPPTVTALTPAEGPSAGGTVITVNGTLFASGMEVRFDVGGVVQQGTSVTVLSVTQLTVRSPAHVDGSATVTVRNPATAAEGSRSDAFRFNAPPTITDVTPSVGAVAGGTTVTLTGTHFRPGPLVRFGNSNATLVTVDPSGTSMTVTTPASALDGPVDVVLLAVDGQQATLADGFRYQLPAPSLTDVTPVVGPSSGGTTLTLTGTNFANTPTVLVGNQAATGVVRTSSTRVVAVTPPGTAGVVSVTFENADGQAASLPAAFTYVAAPSVVDVTPSSGSMLGGQRITLSGAAFQAGMTVRIGGTPASAVSVMSATTASATTPAGLEGAADVEVTNPDTQRSVLAQGYRFIGPPRIVSLAPSSGAPGGGTVVTVTGSNFVAGTTLALGTQTASLVTVLSATQLTAVVPAGTAGVVSATVQNPDGQSTTLPGAFRYVEAPTLAAISPSSGDVSGGTVVRLTGSGFVAGHVVTFGNTDARSVTVVNDTTLEVVTPARAAGVVDVKLWLVDGTELATLANGFTYTRGAPTIAAVTPTSGPSAGGTTLTISGTNFAATTTVTLGGVAATDVVLASPELLRARTPEHAAGAVEVVVTNDDGQSATRAGAFTYVAASDAGTTLRDGGTGGVGEPPDAGVDPTKPTGCGCAGLEGSGFVFAALGLLLRRRRG